MDVVGIVTAGAAIVAAGLSGVTLFVTGRREHARWIREEALSVFVEFLDASHDHAAACSRLRQSRGTLTEAETHELWLRLIREHKRESDAIVRLRLLAPAAVVEAAVRLHGQEHEAVDLLLDDGASLRDPEVAAAMQIGHELRLDFIEATRSALRTGAATPIVHSHAPTRWREVIAMQDGRG